MLMSQLGDGPVFFALPDDEFLVTERPSFIFLPSLSLSPLSSI